MNTRHIVAIVALAIAAPAFAEDNIISTLADHSGLSERKVRMVLGNRSAYAEYRYTYDRAAKQLEDSIGSENFDRLMAGERIELGGADKGTAVAQADTQPHVPTP